MMALTVGFSGILLTGLVAAVGACALQDTAEDE
jgi:hypothetical protein